MPVESPALEDRVRERFLSENGPLGDPTERLVDLLAEEDPLLSPKELECRARALCTDLIGLGAIQELLDDPEVTDVLVNGPGVVWVERSGRLEPTVVNVDRAQVLTAVERLVAPLGLRADRAHPIVDGRLPDGTRVSVILDPLAVDGPLLAVRRHRAVDLRIDQFGSEEVTALLRDAVSQGHNLLIYGATGSGKTTLLSSLMSEVDPSERIVVIEDVSELRSCGGHVVRLECRAGSGEGPGSIELGALVRAALRLRPDRLVVGEVRGPEAVDMVWALSTGHRGCMSTVHAAGADDAMRRIETMMALGLGESVPLSAIRRQLTAAVDLLVGVARGTGAQRSVREVHAVEPSGLRRVHPPEEAVRPW